MKHDQLPRVGIKLEGPIGAPIPKLETGELQAYLAANIVKLIPDIVDQAKEGKNPLEIFTDILKGKPDPKDQDSKDQKKEEGEPKK